MALYENVSHRLSRTDLVIIGCRFASNFTTLNAKQTAQHTLPYDLWYIWVKLPVRDVVFRERGETQHFLDLALRNVPVWRYTSLYYQHSTFSAMNIIEFQRMNLHSLCHLLLLLRCSQFTLLAAITSSSTTGGQATNESYLLDQLQDMISTASCMRKCDEFC